jgi:hypothetical protein
MDCAVHAMGHRVLGAVCRDVALSEALAHKQLLMDGNAGAAEDLRLLADRIATRLHLPPPGREATGFPALAAWGLR